MQNYLHSAPKKEIERICESLLGCFPELVAHEYGNYTAQKLFKVCNPDLRFRLLLRISQDIPTLICNKQGTHTLQAFVRFFGCQ